jgi:HEAT repeat protein
MMQTLVFLLCLVVLISGCNSRVTEETETKLPSPRNLMEKIESEDPRTRLNAAFELIKAGVYEPPVAGVLTEALSHTDRDVRFNALCALGSMGPIAAESERAVAVLLSEEDKILRLTALRTLSTIKSTKRDTASQLLTLVTEESDTDIRVESVRTLGAMAKRLPEIADSLFLLLTDPDVGPDASIALSGLGVEVLPLLIRGLQESNVVIIRQRCACAIADIGHGAARAKPVLETLLGKASEDDERVCFLYTLASLTETSDQYVEAIGKILEDNLGNSRMVHISMGFLTKLGKKAKGSIGLLLKIVADSRKQDSKDAFETCSEGFRALGAIAASSPSEMLRFAKDSSTEMGQVALKVLSYLDSPPQEVVLLFACKLQDKDIETRRMAIKGLANASVVTPRILQELENLLEDDSPTVRDAAKNALQKLNKQRK